MNGSAAGDAGGRSKSARNLRLRILSALVMGIVVLVVAYLGGAPFRLLAALMAGAVFFEWRAMTAEGDRAVVVTAWVLLVAVLAFMVASAPAVAVFALIVTAAVVVAIVALARKSGLGLAAGLLYAALPAAAIVFVRGDDFSGILALLFLFLVVWTTDIAAFFVGRAIGGRRLAPSISPGKTWSGAIGGAVGAVIVGTAFSAWAGAVGPALLALACVSAVLSVVSQLGDLFESALKRRGGVKDSGRLIPGHGGVMDRVDGLVAAGFVFYLMGAVLAGAQTPAHAFFA